MKYLLVIGVAACGFRGPAAGARDGSVGDGTALHDSPPPGDALGIDAPLDAKLSGAFCASSDQHLRACFAFEGNTDDGSPYHSTVMQSGVITYDLGGQDGKAARLGAGTTILLAQSDASNVTVGGLALRAYVKLPTLPAGTARMGIVDNDAYRLFVQANGTVRCAIGADGSVADATSAIGFAANTWTRIACLYDGLTLSIFFDYVPVGGQTSLGSIPATTTQTAIGSHEPSGDNLVGLLDDVEIYDWTLAGP